MAVNHSETDAVERSVARTANRRVPGQACATGLSGGAKPVADFSAINFDRRELRSHVTRAVGTKWICMSSIMQVR